MAGGTYTGALGPLVVGPAVDSDFLDLGITKMKIGLSYSRCVLDIVEGRVDMADVLVIIARTDFDPRDDAQWSGIWAGYRGGNFANTRAEWGSSDHTEQEFRDVSIELWETGRLHQPRKFGWNPGRRAEFWLEAVLPPSELERNPAARDAWERFQVIAGLSNIRINRDYS